MSQPPATNPYNFLPGTSIRPLDDPSSNPSPPPRRNRLPPLLAVIAIGVWCWFFERDRLPDAEAVRQWIQAVNLTWGLGWKVLVCGAVGWCSGGLIHELFKR